MTNWKLHSSSVKTMNSPQTLVLHFKSLVWNHKWKSPRLSCTFIRRAVNLQWNRSLHSVPLVFPFKFSVSSFTEVSFHSTEQFLKLLLYVEFIFYFSQLVFHSMKMHDLHKIPTGVLNVTYCSRGSISCPHIWINKLI